MSGAQYLERHGTEAIVLMPSSVVSAAEADLRRAANNKECSGGHEHYAFHRKHVRKAAKKALGARGVIRLALEEIGIGKASGKKWTRYLYERPELLKAALESPEAT